MKEFILLIVSISLSGISLATCRTSRDRNNKPYIMMCYHAAWSHYRLDSGKFSPRYIDTQACTHIVYAFAVLVNNRITHHDKWMDLDISEDDGNIKVQGHYKLFNNLRKSNKHLTTLIALGGWTEGNRTNNPKYSTMVASPVTRKIFVDSVVEFLKKHDFDGLDFDWEYPALRDGISRPQEREYFVLVLKELKAAFEPHGFILTAAVAAGKATMEASYDIPQINKYLDIINVMSYDFHGAFDSYTGHNAPMYARSDESYEDKYKTLDYAIRYWIDEGADRKKITLGIPLYGRCYKLKDRKKTDYGAPSTGPGSPGPFTREEGMMGYFELCMKDKQERWTVKWNECHLAPNMYSGDQWCSFDNDDSVMIKVEYVKAMGLGGAMIWSIDTDDFHGFCTRVKFPLLTKIVDVLKDSSTPKLPYRDNGCISMNTTKKDSTETPTVTPTPSTTTFSPEVHKLCKRWGVVALPDHCNKFVKCVPYGMDFNATIMDCPESTAFHAEIKLCDYKDRVPGCS